MSAAAFAPYEPSRPRRPTLVDLRVRRAHDADVEDLARLGADRQSARPTDLLPWARRQLERARADRDGRFLVVAETGTRGIGYGLASWFAAAPSCPSNAAPTGFYLTGVVVDPAYRRAGVGRALTEARLAWVAARSPEVFYFCDVANRATIALHAPFGFVERTRDFWFPGVALRPDATYALYGRSLTAR